MGREELQMALSKHYLVVLAFCAPEFGVCRNLINEAFPVLRRKYPEDKGYCFLGIMTEDDDGNKINISLANTYGVEEHLKVMVLVDGQKQLEDNRCWGSADEQVETIEGYIKEVLAKAAKNNCSDSSMFHQPSFVLI